MLTFGLLLLACECLGLAAAVLARGTRGFPEVVGAGTSPYTDGTLQHVHCTGHMAGFNTLKGEVLNFKLCEMKTNKFTKSCSITMNDDCFPTLFHFSYFFSQFIMKPIYIYTQP